MLKQWKELVERIVGYHPEADVTLLNQAYEVVAQASRSPEWEEAATPVPCDCIQVAEILSQLRLDVASIVAGMLVSVVRQGGVEMAAVRKQFGADVAFLVEGVAKITLLSPRAQAGAQPEELRKMVLASAKDIRVVLIRLAMCLQRLRAAASLQPREPVAVAADVLDIYAPIAHRLGIHWIKSEMEDLAFRLSQPDTYHTIHEEIERRRQGGRDVVRKVVAFLKEKLKTHNIRGQVGGREKHVYSIWQKMARKEVTLDEMYDLIAYRIIVRKKRDCYRVLGMIHGELTPVPGRFKDYIALPKSNGYQSLHSVVIGPFKNRIEIQIRTKKMHDVAESGVAAHWVYKSKGLKAQKGATGYAWLKRLLEIHQNTEDPSQFLENVKIDLFPDEIYVFTPAGRILTLPRGATPVDFAYAVHSDLGDHCQGARVNGRMVPLKTLLVSGDTVEVLTGSQRHPSTNWLQFVATSKAKSRISRWLKEQQREELVDLGREMLEREARKVGHGAEVTERIMQRVLEGFHAQDCDDLLFRLGLGELHPTQVVHRMFPEGPPRAKVKPRTPDTKPLPPKPVSRSIAKGTTDLEAGLNLLSQQLGGMAVFAARCCSPVPGDDIVGIISTGKGVTIHTRDCPNLSNFNDEPARWVEGICWPEGTSLPFVARLKAVVRNEKGVLVQVSGAVTDAKGHLLEAHIQDQQREPCTMILELEVTSQTQLERVVEKIRAVPVVLDVERMKG